jgi:hypothetical protein
MCVGPIGAAGVLAKTVALRILTVLCDPRTLAATA